jgi:hypothetical protein
MRQGWPVSLASVARPAVGTDAAQTAARFEPAPSFSGGGRDGVPRRLFFALQTLRGCSPLLGFARASWLVARRFPGSAIGLPFRSPIRFPHLPCRDVPGVLVPARSSVRSFAALVFRLRVLRPTGSKTHKPAIGGARSSRSAAGTRSSGRGIATSFGGQTERPRPSGLRIHSSRGVLLCPQGPGSNPTTATVFSFHRAKRPAGSVAHRPANLVDARPFVRSESDRRRHLAGTRRFLQWTRFKL